MSNRLRARGLVKRYSRKGPIVVNQVDLDVETGEIVGLLGPNGAGKSTTFYIAVGLIRPNAGQLFYDDRYITFLSMYKRAI
ncbi:MAG: ATP-binding cassette domain-containing protein, partial [Candidatus Poribacteria bacterium]|nr:ATP-binding cassette domain-containing protein [Candidatus Poribacteria bacterium]